MKLHQIQKFTGTKKTQRLGRGGKRGTTSGRGQKGQKSRSGHRIRPAQRDVLLRIPKRRGFRNKPQTKVKTKELSVARVMAKIKPLAEGKKSFAIDMAVLKQLALVPLRFRGVIKLIGPVPKEVIGVQLQGIGAAASVKAAIEKAGGSV